ncbi:MAG: response regulator [Elusimicrobiota bacterium]
MSRKVLLVDDEAHILLYLTTLLQDNGYEAISTSDPFEGLALAKKEHAGLICLDIMMPKRSGLSLYKDLKRNEVTKDIPIAIISGIGGIAYGFKQDFRRHLPDPDIPEPEAFFEKPIDVKRFIDFLDSVFARGDRR